MISLCQDFLHFISLLERLYYKNSCPTFTFKIDVQININIRYTNMPIKKVTFAANYFILKSGIVARK